MWQPGWPDGSNGAENRNGVDWGLAAQQWIQYKESYEQWVQQQYQQHLQMMANAHAAAVASIDPGVVTNPPPPPPADQTTADEKNSAENLNSSNPAKKSLLKSRFSNSPLLKAAAIAVANSTDSADTNPGVTSIQSDASTSNTTKPKPLFAAYDPTKVKYFFLDFLF